MVVLLRPTARGEAGRHLPCTSCDTGPLTTIQALHLGPTTLGCGHDPGRGPPDRRALAAADPPAPGPARLPAGQGLAPPPGARRRGGQERRLRPARGRAAARGLRVAAARDRLRRRRGVRLRGAHDRRPHRPGGQGHVRPGARRRLRGAGQAGARPRRRAGRGAGGREARRSARAARAAAGAARPGRRDRLLRRPREPGGRGPAGRPGGPAARGRAGRARGTGRRPRPAARADLGDAPGRPRRPHRLGVAGPPLRRRGGDLQVRAGQGLRARAGRAALRHVRRRVHPRGRPLHLRGPAAPGRAGRPGAARHRRAGARPRPQGRPVRPPRGGGARRPGRGPVRGDRRRRRAPRPRGRHPRRPPRPLRQERAVIGTSAVREGATGPAAPRPHGVPFAEAVRTWARVAALSFGGPAGQIAVMHRILVEEKRWIGEGRFLHALNFCMLLPGPEATELAIYVGWLLHRTAGGLAAGTLFVLPGYVALMVLSAVYAVFGKVGAVQALFFGLKAAVLAIVLEAVVRIGRRALKDRVMVAIAAAAFVGIFFLKLPFPLIILAAVVVGFFGARFGNPAFLVGGGHGAAKGEAFADADS